MFVYFIRGVEGGPIKIGRASSPAMRLAQLQAMSPIQLEIIGLCRGGSIEENHLHRKFEPQRQHGEWFEPCDELLALIEPLPTDEDNDEIPSLARDQIPVTEMYAAGYTMGEIGSVFGVTKQRIHQILSQYDYKDMKRAKRQKGVSPRDFYYNLIGG